MMAVGNGASDVDPRATPVCARRTSVLVILSQGALCGPPNARWVAAGRYHDVTITITITIAAREIDPASLIIARIADTTARLLGPEPDQPRVAPGPD
jgi:hypothetical protein